MFKAAVLPEIGASSSDVAVLPRVATPSDEASEEHERRAVATKALVAQIDAVRVEKCLRTPLKAHV